MEILNLPYAFFFIFITYANLLTGWEKQLVKMVILSKIYLYGTSKCLVLKSFFVVCGNNDNNVIYFGLYVFLAAFHQMLSGPSQV